MKNSKKPQNPVSKRPAEGGVKLCHSIIFYFPWLIKEMLISSIRVAKLVLTPKKVEPKIVTLKTGIKSNIGKVIYANSITLTPGTFTIDIEKDSLTVHFLVHKDGELDEMEQKIRGILC